MCPLRDLIGVTHCKTNLCVVMKNATWYFNKSSSLTYVCQLYIQKPHCDYMDYQSALNFLLAGDPLVLTTHVHADGDGLGAVLGLSHWLTRQAQAHRILVADETLNRKFRFLPGHERVELRGAWDDDSAVQRLVVVDAPTLSKERVGEVANLIGPATQTLVIDHHLGEGEEGDVRVLARRAS